MPENRSKRIAPKLLDEDNASFAALLTIENYAPANAAYKLNEVQAVKTEMDAMQVEEAQMIAALATLRDNIRAKEWRFHDKIVGVRDQITAQFGRDSTELQAIGRKRSSERKRPTTGAARKSNKNKPNP